MKKLHFIPMMLASFTLLMIACQKNESILSESFENQETKSTTAKDDSRYSTADLPEKTLNGRLVFDSFEDFRRAILAVNTINDTNLNKWEENIGFNSVRKLIALAKDEYEQLKTEEDLKIFLSKYENKFTFNDGSIHGNIRWRNISALVNEDGWAYIGDNLYKFEEDKQIIIEGAEENKIDLAETSTSSRLEDGIHVFSKEKLESSQVEARSCGSICTTAYYFYDEDKDSDNNKRLRYWWEGFAVQELLPNGNYNTYYYYAREIESRKKQGFIWKRTWIDVKFDHDVSFCYPSCNFPEDDISFDQTVFDVADYVAFSEILILQDEVASCALYHVTINSVADRIESPNTNDLQCVVSCN